MAFLRAIDRLSFAFAVIAMAMLIGLVFSMVYEATARYAFNAPTRWSYDVSYMLNGGLIFLAAAFTLTGNNHVRIDFLSTRLPVRGQHAINFAVYALLFLPILGACTWAAIAAAWNAAITGELEPVSAWRPKIWPFYTAVATGLAGLWLQALTEALRHAVGIIQPGNVRSPAQSVPH
ncbi:MAG: TRAP transporter small permease subunit [Alphaproteobacteria bacterium]|nr:TRAP transporter small permease subunit [Alphaproteobacteria bacterium]